jgi:hypothetical protein
MNFSPVGILVGTAQPFIPINSQVTNFFDQCKFDPGWPERPIIPNNIGSNIFTPKHMTSVSLYDSALAIRPIFGDPDYYSKKSVMSLDGIFSPVSLYPSHSHATYHISKYRRDKCPMCLGNGIYEYTAFDENIIRNSTTFSQMRSSETTRTIDCPYCLPSSEIDKLKEKGTQPSELTPPFLIGSGTDREIISDKNKLLQFKTPIINNYNYNPIVLSSPVAEFSCGSNRQDNDRCAHCIDVVGFGNAFPSFEDSLMHAISPDPTRNFNVLDTNAFNGIFTQNHRFFGLRGPVILHSWGYDLEGYPVPNSSGEYKLQGNSSNIIRDSDNNPVGKNQTLQSNGKWSAPYKESTFMKGWAQQPASWPVGPIDFRWDDVGRVWTIGANYKPVWVVIEHDLLDEDPVRGIIIESSYSNNPLPSGLRKLAFVKDTVGMFSAPRGAALYCKYDSVNGFYEPIYNRPLITSGLIEGGRTATIYTAYTPSSVSEDIVSEYNTVFDNPLNISVNTNSIGLFIFLNGSWILQASRG